MEETEMTDVRRCTLVHIRFSTSDVSFGERTVIGWKLAAEFGRTAVECNGSAFSTWTPVS